MTPSRSLPSSRSHALSASLWYLAAATFALALVEWPILIANSAVQHTSVIYGRLGLAETRNDHRRVLAVLRYLSG
jgi:hypothetical protein